MVPVPQGGTAHPTTTTAWALVKKIKVAKRKTPAAVMSPPARTIPITPSNRALPTEQIDMP